MAIDKPTQQRFEQCIESCADGLFRVAFRLTCNRALASELVQETYLNAWRSLDSLKEPMRMRSWMFAILRNQYSKLIRKETKNVQSTEQMDSFAHDDISQEDTGLTTPTDRIQAALEQLDEKHKLPLLLVAMEQMSVEQAATILEVPQGTVMSRLHRGRQKLKEILNRESNKTK